MAEEIKTIEQFFNKWSAKTLYNIKAIVRTKAYRTGKLFNSLKLGLVKDEESGYSATLSMVYYGKYVDEGHKTPSGRFKRGVNFTEPMTNLRELIPGLEKAYADYVAKMVANEIDDKEIIINK